MAIRGKASGGILVEEESLEEIVKMWELKVKKVSKVTPRILGFLLHRLLSLRAYSKAFPRFMAVWSRVMEFQVGL